jgi:hypothetical protein
VIGEDRQNVVKRAFAFEPSRAHSPPSPPSLTEIEELDLPISIFDGHKIDEGTVKKGFPDSMQCFECSTSRLVEAVQAIQRLAISIYIGRHIPICRLHVGRPYNIPWLPTHTSDGTVFSGMRDYSCPQENHRLDSVLGIPTGHLLEVIFGTT